MHPRVKLFMEKYSRMPTEFDPDYLEMLNMSKYRLLDVPDFSPGKCANCGASKNDGRKYIDFGLQIDLYGALYLCGACFNEIGKELGIFLPLTMQLLEAVKKSEQISELQEQGVKLHETVLELVKEFEEYYAGLHFVGNDISLDSSTVLDTDSSTREPYEPSVTETKSRTSQSTPSSGSQNVRSLADLLNESSGNYNG